MTSSFKSLRVEIGEGVAEVELLGPGKGNAMGSDFWRECLQAFAALDEDEVVRAVLVYGAGDHFSYGLDLFAMMGDLGPHLSGKSLAKERTLLLESVRRYQAAFSAVARCRKPVIAAVHGWCIGGGLDLIAACDLRLCSAAARFSLREVKIAIVADLGSLQRLPAIIGEGWARQLAFSGEDVDADDAARMGLVNRVLPDKEALLSSARELAARIAANPPLAVQGIKQVMNQARERSVQEGLDYVAVWNAAFLQSHDLAEAIAAFTEKRPPRYQGA